jgi:type IV pilus assembly protein PilF
MLSFTLIRVARLLPLCAALLIGGCIVEPVSDSLSGNKDLAKAQKNYVHMAMVYIQNRDMTQADRALRRATDIGDDDAALHNAWGLFFLVEQDDEKAEEHFLRAIAEDPEFSAAYNNYGAMLFRQKRYEEAIERLSVVNKHYRYEMRHQSFETLGQSYLALGRTADAGRAFSKALQLSPRMAGSLLGMAQISFAQGDYAAADHYLTQFETLGRRTPEQLWLGIRLQRQLGDKNRLASYELSLRKLYPGSAQFKEYEKSITP